jgi:UDP-N-acetylmuramate dehydrogenase
MAFPDLVPLVKKTMPELRGRVLANQSLAELTWFRVGGPAQLLFMPDDESDLSYFLAHLPADVPVTVIGLGSNLMTARASAPALPCRMSKSLAPRRRPASPDCRSCAAFPARSAAHCA